jgi:hypothetical protein
MRRAPVAITVAGLAAAGLIAFAFRRAPAPPPVAELSGREPAAADELAELRRKVASLERRSVTPAAPAPPPVAAPAPPRPSMARLPPAEQKRLVTEALESRYGGEAVDAAWSPTRVKEIKTAFASALPEVTVLAAECATTLCRVLVQHADGDSQGSLMERAAEADGLGTQTIYLFDKDANPPRTTLYMARAGHRLPQPRL